MSACQPGQTSFGETIPTRESCKHHWPEWHDPSNYLSSLDCGPAPYREASCRLMAEHRRPRTHTHTHKDSSSNMGSQYFPWHLFLAVCCSSVVDAVMFFAVSRPTLPLFSPFKYLLLSGWSLTPFFLACLKAATAVLFCSSPYSPHLVMHHPNQCFYCSLLFSPVSFSSSPSSLSFSLLLSTQFSLFLA